MRSPLVLLAVIATVAAVAGCGSSSKPATGGGLSVDITIAHGQVTPANATLQAAVKQPITLHVTSDVPDELHVHSVPDHKFEVAAAAN
jgi:ABC-type glycerol-3-phosphate transport system substrate-binding protein